MKATVIGGGPAGLNAAIQLKASKAAKKVQVLERLGKRDRPGLGYTLRAETMMQIASYHPRLFRKYENRVMPITESQGFAGTHKDCCTLSFPRNRPIFGISRSDLIDYLSTVAKKHGVSIKYDQEITPERVMEEKERADLLVGADGVNSVVRGTFEEQFGVHVQQPEFPYLWLHANGNSNQMYFADLVMGDSLVSISSYPYTPGGISAVIDYSRSDGNHTKLELNDEESLKSVIDYLSSFFSMDFQRNGATKWKRFKQVSCDEARYENVVLVGDSFLSPHYQAGAGAVEAMQAGDKLAICIGLNSPLELGIEAYNEFVKSTSANMLTISRECMDLSDHAHSLFTKYGKTEFLERKMRNGLEL